MKALNKKELAALAMHELMKREQERYNERVQEQRKVAALTDKQLKELVNN